MAFVGWGLAFEVRMNRLRSKRVMKCRVPYMVVANEKRSRVGEGISYPASSILYTNTRKLAKRPWGGGGSPSYGNSKRLRDRVAFHPPSSIGALLYKLQQNADHISQRQRFHPIITRKSTISSKEQENNHRPNILLGFTFAMSEAPNIRFPKTNGNRFGFSIDIRHDANRIDIFDLNIY